MIAISERLQNIKTLLRVVALPLSHTIIKVIKQRGIMTPTTQPLESELIEIEQDLDTEDFYIDDLYESEDSTSTAYVKQHYEA